MERNDATEGATATEPVPIIACGKTVETGQAIARLIHPEFQVIHFFQSFEDAKANLADLLAGRGPTSPSPNQTGTHDYSKPPRAVIFGRAFDPEQAKELNRLYRGMGSVPIAWIAGDPAVKPPAAPGQSYAENAAKNVTRAFRGWEEAGGVSEDIVYY